MASVCNIYNPSYDSCLEYGSPVLDQEFQNPEAIGRPAKGIPSRFFGIRDLDYWKTGIRDLRGKVERDSGIWNLWKALFKTYIRDRDKPIKSVGITGLRKSFSSEWKNSIGDLRIVLCSF